MNSPKNILILTYWSFDDALVQTYTLPYLKIIAKQLPAESKIYLLTMEKNNSSKNVSTSNDTIINIQIPYIPFGLKAIFAWWKNILFLNGFIKKHAITFIHAWCTPAGMIGYILSKLCKTPLILDSFEPHAESMVENGEWKRNGMAFKLLFLFEKLQYKRATAIVATTEGMKGYAKEKYGPNKNNIFVKPACVDLSLFSNKNIKDPLLISELKLENKIVCVYAGKFGGIYYDQEVFDFFKIAENHWGTKFKALILSSSSPSSIQNMANKAGILHETILHHFVKHSEIPKYMGLADFAITTVKPVPSKRYCSPIKDGEYWALGLPVVITKNISDDSKIIQENKIGSILHDTHKSSYLEAIMEIDELLKTFSRDDLYKKIRPFAEKYRNFEIAEKIYAQIYRDE